MTQQIWKVTHQSTPVLQQNRENAHLKKKVTHLYREVTHQSTPVLQQNSGNAHLKSEVTHLYREVTKQRPEVTKQCSHVARRCKANSAYPMLLYHHSAPALNFNGILPARTALIISALLKVFSGSCSIKGKNNSSLLGRPDVCVRSSDIPMSQIILF